VVWGHRLPWGEVITFPGGHDFLLDLLLLAHLSSVEAGWVMRPRQRDVLQETRAAMQVLLSTVGLQ